MGEPTRKELQERMQQTLEQLTEVKQLGEEKERIIERMQQTLDARESDLGTVNQLLDASRQETAEALKQRESVITNVITARSHATFLQSVTLIWLVCASGLIVHMGHRVLDAANAINNREAHNQALQQLQFVEPDSGRQSAYSMTATSPVTLNSPSFTTAPHDVRIVLGKDIGKDIVITNTEHRDCWVQVSPAKGTPESSQMMMHGGDTWRLPPLTPRPIGVRDGCPGALTFRVDGELVHPKNQKDPPGVVELVTLP